MKMLSVKIFDFKILTDSSFDIFIVIGMIKAGMRKCEGPIRKLFVGPFTLQNHFKFNGFCHVIFNR